VNKKILGGRKLVLNRETVRRLTTAEQEGVVGGRWNQSIITQCECPTFGCTDPVPSTLVNTACNVTKVGDCDF
jgi:hypothetical protein